MFSHVPYLNVMNNFHLPPSMSTLYVSFYYIVAIDNRYVLCLCVFMVRFCCFFLAFSLLSESEWLKRFALVLHDVPFKNYYVPNSTFQGARTLYLQGA